MTQLKITKEATRKPQKKRKLCPFSGTNKVIDYKDVKTLTRYVSERGKLYRLEFLRYREKTTRAFKSN